jgi:hypothetical protein
MDVGLDQAGGDKPASEVDLVTLGRERGLDCGDPAALYSDIKQAVTTV